MMFHVMYVLSKSYLIHDLSEPRHDIDYLCHMRTTKEADRPARLHSLIITWSFAA